MDSSYNAREINGPFPLSFVYFEDFFHLEVIDFLFISIIDNTQGFRYTEGYSTLVGHTESRN